VSIEIINTGSELMLGRVLNTHQQWLCRQLTDAGYAVDRQTAVADRPADIRQTVTEALGRAAVVITTGGLGPTTDDLTREVIAELVGSPLREDPATLQRIQDWFALRKRQAPPSVRIQATVPEGAVIVANRNGTAPGLIMEVDGSRFGSTRAKVWLVMLPGPPRELRPMFRDQVLPWLKEAHPLAQPYTAHTLKTTGLGESAAQELIAPALVDLVQQGLEIGYCARTGEVDLRFAARQTNAAALVVEAERRVIPILDQYLFGREEDSLEGTVVRMLTDRKATLAVAESCTGGLLAHRITNVPGASEVFKGGAITYSNELKLRLTGVKPETLAAHGAVSEATAREMAEGARERFGADYALAITGIAGPGGGSEAKPVGTVFVALAHGGGTEAIRSFNTYDRETFKNVTAQQALELLRRRICHEAAAGGSLPRV
jgi:nicotinamide-nucleotide amidase